MCGIALHPQLVGGERGALDPGPDLGERGVARGGGVIGKRSEAAVVTRTEPVDRDMACGGKDPVPDFLSCLHARVNRVSDADEYPSLRRKMLGDDTQDT